MEQDAESILWLGTINKCFNSWNGAQTALLASKINETDAKGYAKYIKRDPKESKKLAERRPGDAPLGGFKNTVPTES